MPLVVHRSSKLCSGPLNRVYGIVRIRLFRYKLLRQENPVFDGSK